MNWHNIIHTINWLLGFDEYKMNGTSYIVSIAIYIYLLDFLNNDYLVNSLFCVLKILIVKRIDSLMSKTHRQCPCANWLNVSKATFLLTY